MKTVMTTTGRQRRALVLSALISMLSGCERPQARLAGAAPESRASSDGAKRLSSASFRALMQTVADGWNQNDAQRAVDCFTDDARYSSPPNPRIRSGRAALYEFFGGPEGRPRPMRMEWHHLLFDEESQIGAGEYTFEYGIRTHGLVIVRIVTGKIANWREYEHESPLPWNELVAGNSF